MDPQQRQLLERGYAAFHAARKTKAAMLGAVVAVNVGQWASEFGAVLSHTPSGRSVYASTGFSCSVTCGRVSFALGLQGPCASYDTACSASLVGNHGSARALQRLECDAALSAGVNMILDPSTMVGNAIAGFTSVRGRSHTFDARADGYARGEAIDAIACRLGDDDVVVAVLGSAVRQDGRSASLTAPNGQAQRSVLVASYSDAHLVVESTSMLEAHGTGTALGDPVETGAAAAVFLAQRSIGELIVGSLKANAGHTEPGAGLAGATKLVEQLREQANPPNAQLRALNPHVGGALRGLACTLPTQLAAGGRGAAGGVSSFGYSGTIAHAVLRGVASGEGARDAAPRPLAFRRRAFAWREPPHPFAQSRVGASESAVTVRSPVVGSLHALVADHVVHGRVIFPGAGYLEVARAAAATASALRGVFFLQPLAVVVEPLAGTLVECSVAGGRFEVRSGEEAAPEDAAVHCSGALAAGDGACFVGSGSGSAHVRVGQHAAHGVGALYDGFDTVGLQYGPGYRTLVQAWGGSGSALARLQARSTRAGTAVHPADLDDALCVGALATREDEGGETRLPFAVDDSRLRGAPGQPWAASRIARSNPAARGTHSPARARAGRGATQRRGNGGATRASRTPAAGAARRLQVARAAGRGTDAARSLCKRVACARRGRVGWGCSARAW